MIFNRKIASIKLFFTLLAIIAGAFEAAAEITVEAQLSGSVLIVGDQLNLVVKVDGARQNATIQLPQIEGISFQRSGPPISSSQTIINNGKVSSFSGLIHNIGVVAEKAGDYLITGIKVKYKNKLYPVKQFRLKAINAGQESKMKVVVLVSDKEIYLHQPLEITIKWYLQENVDDYAFRFPLLDLKDKLQLKAEPSNAEAIDLRVHNHAVPFQKRGENVQNEPYTVYEAKLRVYPFRSGIFKIPAATVKAAVERGSDLKRDFFGRLIRSPKLKNIFAASKPIQVHVKALPERNRPLSFSGGVGKYQIEIAADAARVKVGDPLELSIRISGKGKLDNIERPLLSETPQYKDDFTIVESLQPGNIEGGAITFKQIIRPNHRRISQVPPAEFTYFDPESEKYVAVKSNSLPLKVLASQKVAAKDIIVHDQDDGFPKTKLTEKQEGIHANYSPADILESQAESRAWLLWLVVPPPVCLLCLLVLKRREKLRGDQTSLRVKSAKSRRDKRLKKAKALMSQNDEKFFAELASALSGYVADNFGLGAGELTGVDVRKLREKQRISSETAEKLTSCLNELDRPRFTNRQMTNSEKEQIFELTINAIKKLEKEL